MMVKTVNEKYNVVLLTIDALRYDHCGFNGYDRDVSPSMDKLAVHAVVFDGMYSTGPCTPPAFNSLFTATFPFDKGGYSPLPAQKSTIAEAFQKHGYQTAGFTSNPQNSHFFNYDKGFVKFYDNLISSSKNPLARRVLAYFESSGEKSNALYNRLQSIKLPKTVQVALMRLFYRVLLGRSFFYYLPARGITRWARKWLYYHYFQDMQNREPFFLWIHYMDTHGPFKPKWKNLVKVNPRFPRSAFDYIQRFPEYTDVLKEYKQKKVLVDLYDAGIRAIDERIGFFVRGLKRRRAYEKTIFFLMADHGEEFNDHGDFGHCAHLYNELLHVPFMIFGGPIERGEFPSLLPGTRVSSLHSLVQVAPTILQLVGIPAPPSFDAGSILEILNGSSPEAARNEKSPVASSIGEHIMACTYHKGIVTRFNRSKDRAIKQAISLQNDRLKYIFDTETMKQELYDLQADPQEKQNIASEHEDILHAFHELAWIYLKGSGHLLISRKRQELETEKEKLLGALQRVKARL
jgi:arylsulfatase A-like enzyme